MSEWTWEIERALEAAWRETQREIQAESNAFVLPSMRKLTEPIERYAQTLEARLEELKREGAPPSMTEPLEQELEMIRRILNATRMPW